MLKIEKNIPFTSNLPDRTAFPRKWPWTEMQPGDSFTVSTKAEMHSARNSFYQHRRTVHCKLPESWNTATKKIPGGYRLWLIDTKKVSDSC